MAVSVTASTISSFSSDRTTRIAATSSSSASCSKLSSSSFLQVPVQLRCVRIGRSGVSAPSRPRILPVVIFFQISQSHALFVSGETRGIIPENCEACKFSSFNLSCGSSFSERIIFLCFMVKLQCLWLELCLTSLINLVVNTQIKLQGI